MCYGLPGHSSFAVAEFHLWLTLKDRACYLFPRKGKQGTYIRLHPQNTRYQVEELSRIFRSWAPKLFDQDKWLFSSCFLELNIVPFNSIKEALIECFLWARHCSASQSGSGWAQADILHKQGSHDSLHSRTIAHCSRWHCCSESFAPSL